MITLVSMDNMMGDIDAYKAQYRLRHRSFLERQSYKVHSYKCMEYDQYDNPSAIYLIYEDKNSQEALGVSRLTPTSHRSMLEDLFPEMVKDHSVFKEDNVWEGTRFCVERDIPPDLRRKVVHALVGSYFEFGFHFGVKKIIGMMPTLILKSVFQRSGCNYCPLGPVKLIGGQRIQAASMEINFENYERFKRRTRLQPPLINNVNIEQLTAA